MTTIDELDARLTHRLDTLTEAVNRLVISSETTNQKFESTTQQLVHLSEQLTVYLRDSNDRLTRLNGN